MQYLGSKNRIAKYLLPIMLAEKKPEQLWIEPFVGGSNMIDKVYGNRIGNDINEYLIALFIAIQNGYSPPDTISKELYDDIKCNKEKYPKELVGFVGFGCSYGAKWFDGYAKNSLNRNYALQAKINILRQKENIKDVTYTCMPYTKLEFLKNSFIYCDPPYNNTKKYKHAIDYDIFWQWCRTKTIEGHTVFISETVAPEDFKCVFEMKIKNQIHNIKGASGHMIRYERLFKYNNYLL